MLPNVSKLRASSRRPQRGRLVRKRTEPTAGKIPSALMGNLKNRKAWHMEQMPDELKEGTPAERAFWWFSKNPNDPDAQDVVTLDSLAEGYEPTDQWNAHFWFWTGEQKKILVPLPLPKGTMPNPEQWVDAHSVIDVPKFWREPGPGAIIQVTPTRDGMPGEFVHKGALLLQFAMQRRNEPWGVWVKNGDGTETLMEYPYAYRGPGGTGRDLFIPRKDGPQGQHFAEMEQILFAFLEECYRHEPEVNGVEVGGIVMLYDLKNDAKNAEHFGRDKQTNPFPTPWKWGGGTRPSHYDETGWEVALQIGYVRSSYGDEDLYQDENPWHDDSDDEADDQYEYGSGGEDQEETESEEEDMENPAEQALQDIQELAVLAPTFAESSTLTFAAFMSSVTMDDVLVERLSQVSGRLEDPIYTDMIADGMHDDLWGDFQKVVVNMYALFFRLFDWPNRTLRDELQYVILGFLHAASGDRAMADWIKFVVEPKLEALRLWRATHDPENIEIHTVVTQLLEYIGISETQFAAEPMWQFQSKVDIYNFDAAVKDFFKFIRTNDDWNAVRAIMITIDKNTIKSNAANKFYINNLHYDDTFRRTLATLCREVFSSQFARTTNYRRRASTTINFLKAVVVYTTARDGPDALVTFLTNGSTLISDLRAHMAYLRSLSTQDLAEQQRGSQIQSTDHLLKILLYDELLTSDEDDDEDEEPTPQPPAPAPMLRRNSSDGYQARSRTRQRRERGTGATLRRPGLLPRFFYKNVGLVHTMAWVSVA